MKKGFLYILLCIAGFASAQNSLTQTPLVSPKHDFIRCVNMEDYELQLQKQDPTRKARRDAAVKMMNDWIANRKLNHKPDSVIQYTIPVVFHVLWNSASPKEQISLAQIKRQVKVMNDDYNRLNSDTTATPKAFQPVAENFHITFCLAQTDPNGKLTTGVVYKQTSTTAFSNTNNGAKRPSLGGDTAWDPDQYLNIWICNLSGGLLGYSEFPTTPLDNTFGSVILYQAVGDSGYLPIPAYNLGRTITHEVGHLLNLHHPWGDDGGLCPGSGGVDDGAADTPPEGNNKSDGYGDGGGPTFGCPPFPYVDNCSTTAPGIMIENYMEYTNDSCMNLFTQDQYTIALATINGPLAKLVKSATCMAPNSIEEYTFTSSVNIYPNPSAGIFTINISLTDLRRINMEVLNVLGQTVAIWNSNKAANNNYSLDLSGQPNGLYFVKITDGTFSTVKKIMISR
ncbi:MAG TPA: T9SS type A sorting domain-containing protein [Bacteroidia bacterium]|nr:T9SS type A sorting domain-containing protein [Bacteroidia bacterium]